MKTHFALGASLLLTLGSALAGSLMYGNGRAATEESSLQTIRVPANQLEATPELIAMWKASAASTDYVTLKTPL